MFRDMAGGVDVGVSGDGPEEKDAASWLNPARGAIRTSHADVAFSMGEIAGKPVISWGNRASGAFHGARDFPRRSD